MIHLSSLLLVLYHLVLGVTTLKLSNLAEHQASADALIPGLHMYPYC